ncbi:hypothetical protein HanRHA438_Chr12g0571861 [Helianthus annuus]|nr:hypothetical protein HanRHA438_Chr12g0571861 [Helianthus annuus]
MTPAHTLNLIGVLSESKRIINTHSRHFLALSLLFLLPLSCAIVSYPTLYPPTPQHDVVSTQFHHPFTSPQTLIFPLIYTLTTYLISLCALATITYSTFHGFYGRPVKLFPTIKSLLSSFFPLVSTALAGKFLLCLISLSFLMFVFVIVTLIQSLVFVFVIDYNSNSFIWFIAVIGLALFMATLYFQIIWGLAPVIAVTESKWGFEPLWRSAYLINGMSVSGFTIVEDWRSWEFVLQTVVCSGLLGFLVLLLLHYIAANTVLYMYCKALHGELAMEIAEEFAREYVCLPFDDDKVPHIVTVVSG